MHWYLVFFYKRKNYSCARVPCIRSHTVNFINEIICLHGTELARGIGWLLDRLHSFHSIEGALHGSLRVAQVTAQGRNMDVAHGRYNRWYARWCFGRRSG